MVTSKINSDIFLQTFPEYLDVSSRLQENFFPFAIFAGSEVWLLTNSRIPTDLDILVRDEDLAKIAELFNQEVKTKQKEGISAKYILIGNIEIVADIQITKADKILNISLENEVQAKISQLALEGKILLPLLAPEDTLIIKSLLRRGKSEGKFDVEDIASLREAVTLDEEYLKRRLDRLGVTLDKSLLP